MPKIKQLLSQALLLYSSLFFIVAPLLSPPLAYAAPIGVNDCINNNYPGQACYTAASCPTGKTTNGVIGSCGSIGVLCCKPDPNAGAPAVIPCNNKGGVCISANSCPAKTNLLSGSTTADCIGSNLTNAKCCIPDTTATPVTPVSKVNAATAPVSKFPSEPSAACCDSGFQLADGSLGAVWNCGTDGSAYYNYSSPVCCLRQGLVGASKITPAYDCAKKHADSVVTCNWSPLKNDTSPYNGKPAFCFGGFYSEGDLKTHSIDLFCNPSQNKSGTGFANNCGGLFNQTLSTLSGNNVQKYSLANVGTDAIGYDNKDNSNWSCVTGDLDSNVVATINNNFKVRGLSCVATGAAVGLFAAGAIASSVVLSAGIAVVTTPVTIAAAAGAVGVTTATCLAALSNDASPIITGQVLNSGGQVVCQADMKLVLNAKGDAVIATTPTPDPFNTTAFSLCNQVPDGTQQRKDCEACAKKDTVIVKDDGTTTTVGTGSIWTSVGCISTDKGSLITTIIKIALGIAGTGALLMIVAGGFMLSVSQGDTKRVGDAKELITSAVIGLLFIIFSVTILKFIGVTIFQLPGFGNG